MTRSAVLFDVGGPIDTETAFERRADAAIRAAVPGVGNAAYEAACRLAVDSFAPNAYQAILWTLVGEAAAAAWPAVAARIGRTEALELRPGIAALLHDLVRRGMKLGLAANQPESVLGLLDAAGIGGCFAHREVSGTSGLRKPDVRVFLRACAALDVAPEQCVMVGDRIDNDIMPARVLGMATIRVRGGRHAAQRPRSWLETPDAEVTDVPQLAEALRRLFQIS